MVQIWWNLKVVFKQLMSAVKKKNKKFGRLLEPCISETVGPIPFKFDT